MSPLPPITGLASMPFMPSGPITAADGAGSPAKAAKAAESGDSGFAGVLSSAISGLNGQMVGSEHLAAFIGRYRSKLDADATRRFRRGMNQLVTDGIGATRWVNATEGPMSADDVVQAMALAPAAADSNAAATTGSIGSRSGS